MPSAPSTERVPVKACPVCGSRIHRQVMQVGPHPVMRCSECHVRFASPQPSDAELAAIYGPDYVLVDNDPAGEAMVVASKRATADHYLDVLARADVPARGQLLEIGCGQGNFLRQASRRGFDVTGVEYSEFACQRAREALEGRGRVLHGEISIIENEIAIYDVCVLCDVIEHVRDTTHFLLNIRRLLRPGGTLLIVTPSLDSWSHSLLRSRWMEYKAEHLIYYNQAGLARQLDDNGFDRVTFQSGVKKLSLDYVTAHFKKYPVPGITALLRLAHAFTPARLSGHLFPIVASGLVAVARRAPDRR